MRASFVLTLCLLFLTLSLITASTSTRLTKLRKSHIPGIATLTRSNEFETQRAALLAQAAENAPLERDIEWEQQLSSDRRSIHFSRDRSIMDDAAIAGGVAGQIAEATVDRDTPFEL